jgi:hypothetical protein
MLISAPGNIKEAVKNLLVELEGHAHRIWYKPTQQKNSKALKIFPGILAGNVSNMSATRWQGVKMLPILGQHACWC